jgi:hypothetical protein
MIARRYLGLEVGYPGLRRRIGYRRAMPCQRILRVVIYMYWNERDHPVAHFHAYHAGRRASVSVNGQVLAGSLDPRALQFVREWARLRASASARMVPRAASKAPSRDSRSSFPAWGGAQAVCTA